MTTNPLPISEQHVRAKKLLERQKEYKDLEAEISVDKVWFRDQANGETLTETVPGLGTVQVKKPAAGGTTTSTETVTTFDPVAFSTLDKKLQLKLIAAGVVKTVTTTTTTTKKPGTAAVEITLNV